MSKKEMGFGSIFQREKSEAPRVREAAAAGGAKQPLNINIPSELHRQFKAQCTLRGTDMTTEIIRMIEDYLRGGE